MAGENRGLGREVVLARQLFEGLALGLWDEESGEDTAEHEECVDLHDVVEPWVGVGLGSAAGT